MHALNSYRAVEKIKAQPGQDFCVLCYFLLDNTVARGDESVGMVNVLGAYSSHAEAIAFAKTIQDTLDVRNIVVVPKCKWRHLTPKAELDQTSFQPLDVASLNRAQHLSREPKTTSTFPDLATILSSRDSDSAKLTHAAYTLHHTQREMDELSRRMTTLKEKNSRAIDVADSLGAETTLSAWDKMERELLSIPISDEMWAAMRETLMPFCQSDVEADPSAKRVRHEEPGPAPANEDLPEMTD